MAINSAKQHLGTRKLSQMGISFLVLGTVGLSLLAPARAQAVDGGRIMIPDPELGRCIYEELHVFPDESYVPEGGVYSFAISEISSLDFLSCTEAKGPFTDLAGLEHATGLVGLTLWGGTGVEAPRGDVDLSPLSQLGRLQVLDISGNSFKNLPALAELVELEKLTLSHNGLKDLSELGHLPNLQEIYLDQNQIQNISPLSEQKDLKVINLDENRVSNLTALSELPKLEILSASNNKIRDVSPLRNLPTLRILRLEENRIIDFSPLGKLKSSGTLSEVSAMNQEVQLPSVKAGEVVPNPIRDIYGDIYKILEYTTKEDAGKVRFPAKRVGEVSFYWSDNDLTSESRDSLKFSFSGEATLKVLPADPSPVPWIVTALSVAATVGAVVFLRRRRQVRVRSYGVSTKQ
jgi:hypothetical protein